MIQDSCDSVPVYTHLIHVFQVVKSQLHVWGLNSWDSGQVWVCVVDLDLDLDPDLDPDLDLDLDLSVCVFFVLFVFLVWDALLLCDALVREWSGFGRAVLLPVEHLQDSLLELCCVLLQLQLVGSSWFVDTAHSHLHVSELNRWNWLHCAVASFGHITGVEWRGNIVLLHWQANLLSTVPRGQILSGQIHEQS